jgi:hypothetical protein
MPLLAAPIQDLRGCFMDHVDGDTSLDFLQVIDPTIDVRFQARPESALAFSLVVGPDADVRFQEMPNTTLAFSLVTSLKTEVFVNDWPDAMLDWLQGIYEVDLSKEINFDEVFI